MQEKRYYYSSILLTYPERAKKTCSCKSFSTATFGVAMIEVLSLSQKVSSHTHIAKGIGNEDSSLGSTERPLSEEDNSSADSAGGSRSCRGLR
jgi:hypothetical protein